jgi:hypothetical protein
MGLHEGLHASPQSQAREAPEKSWSHQERRDRRDGVLLDGENRRESTPHHRQYPVEVFEAVDERVREGESYTVEEGDEFRSHADNLVVEPSDLILSFRDD